MVLARDPILDPVARDFQRAYRHVVRHEQMDSFKAIVRRARMFHLGGLYNQVPQEWCVYAVPRRQGAGAASIRKEALFALVHPEFGEMSTASKSWRRASKAFQKTLSQASRWRTLGDEFGYGILGLMATKEITSSWVEVLPVAHFTAWIRIIRQVNPGAEEQGRSFQEALDRAVTGRQAPKVRLQLELGRASQPPDGTQPFLRVDEGSREPSPVIDELIQLPGPREISQSTLGCLFADTVGTPTLVDMGEVQLIDDLTAGLVDPDMWTVGYDLGSSQEAGMRDTD